MMKGKRGWAMWLAMGLSIVFIIAGGLSYLSSVQESFWLQSVTDVREVTAQGAHAFEVYIQKDLEMLHGLAVNLAQKKSQDKESILSRLQAFGRENSQCFVIDLDNGLIYSGVENEGKALSEEELAVCESFTDSGVMAPYLSFTTGQKMLGCYECFTFADGTRGIIQKEQLLSSIVDEFSLSFYNNTGFSYIVDKDGSILLRSEHRNSNRTFLNLFDIIDLNENNPQVLESFRTALTEGKSGVARIFYESEEYVYAYVPLDLTDGWYLISVIPNRVIMAQADQVLKSSQVFVLLIVTAMVVYALFVVLLRHNRRRVREKERDIKYREQMFGILANNTEDVFVMYAPGDGEVEYVSPNVERVLGIRPEEVRADITVLNRDEYDKETEDLIRNLGDMEPGAVYELEGERVHRDTRERRWFTETIYRVMIDHADKLIISLSDRTKEKQRKEALEQALDIAETANQAKSTFLSNMSHDIRTPMNAIVGLCTLLQRDADDPMRVREHTRKITSSSQHLLGLINDVLDMSKIESGKTTLNVTEINLAEIIDELGTIIRPQAKARQQVFEISAFGIETEHLLGDKLRINQILINILSNAVKYTQVGGRVDLMIRQMPQTRKNYANLRFVVQDNGMGMSKDYQKTIFQPFTREISSMTNQIQGTGLGMAITKNLVDLMGGIISVESELGKGSTFTVDLELRIQSREIDQDFWKKYGVTKILVVDDEVEVCTSIIGAMAGTGVSMQYAISGMSAIQMVSSQHRDGVDFDLVMIDWKMPDMDGIETARRIREIIPQDIPIMILTAYDWSEIEDQALAAGLDGFLPKPFFLTNFKQMIERLREKDEAASIREAEVSVLLGTHILAAEDNGLNSEILVELLDMAGATCDVEENGRKALERFEQSKPGEYDLILMDVQMPVMNGYEATRAIRACGHPMAKDIPIIAMTANAFAEDIKNALDSGMDVHVAKPIDLGKLEVAYRDCLSRKRGGAKSS